MCIHNTTEHYIAIKGEKSLINSKTINIFYRVYDECKISNTKKCTFYDSIYEVLKQAN